MSIVDEIRKLQRLVDEEEQDISASELSLALIHLLRCTSLKNDAEDDKLCDWEKKISDLHCKMLAEHLWEHDNCGYWGHQYCFSCRAAKYPELMKLSCSDAIAKVGRITEAEYTSAGDVHSPNEKKGSES